MGFMAREILTEVPALITFYLLILNVTLGSDGLMIKKHYCSLHHWAALLSPGFPCGVCSANINDYVQLFLECLLRRRVECPSQVTKDQSRRLIA